MAKRTYTGYQPVSKCNANDMVDICYVTTLNVLGLALAYLFGSTYTCSYNELVVD